MRRMLLLLGAVVLALPAVPTAARAELLHLDRTSITFEIFGFSPVEFRIPDPPPPRRSPDAMVPLISTGVMSLPAGVITDGTEALASDLVMGLPLLSGLTIAFAHGDGRISVNGSRRASLHLPLEGYLIANVLALFDLNAPLAVIGEGGMTQVLEPRGRYGITLSGGGWPGAVPILLLRIL